MMRGVSLLIMPELAHNEPFGEDEVDCKVGQQNLTPRNFFQLTLYLHEPLV